MQKTLDAISEIMDWYREYAKGDQSVEDLLEARDRLATHSYRLAEIVGDAKITYNDSYFMRTINMARERQRLVEAGLKYNKADNEAMIKNEKFYKATLEKEGMALKLEVILRQVNQVLSAMMQRISFLKMQKPSSDGQM